MSRFVEGQDRQQVTLLPECLDDFVGEDNPVRVVDAFVSKLNLAALGFDGVEPLAFTHKFEDLTVHQVSARSVTPRTTG